MQDLTGAMTALITPFKNGKLDEVTYEKLIKRQIAQGIDSVVPVGTTGESATLNMEEHKRCIEIAVATCKGTNAKVIAGAGGNATAEAMELAVHAQAVGADAILSVTPYYNKPTQEGLYQHYKAVANSIEIPVMLYNVPGRTAVDMTADTCVKLFNDISNIYSVKEATGSLERVIELNTKAPDFAVISGDDAIDFPFMVQGGSGCISVTANLLPNLKSEIIHAVQKGDFEEAKQINNMLYPLNKVLFCEANPIPIKAAMYIAGLIDTLEYRLPLTPPTKENMKKIELVMANYDIIK
ncbi:MAG: 4-hydroxy-tetrahydrodipicolinate synthase [Campylobacteraceae bacterium]|jgi:4-hydroxy-tetrahydrodipicolinate synthase|nr:4-hydroxy-tetrahydrodipicolinate synthase [Campylobacteraceae bacterium]MBT3882884.1 4-hydroxy-tetrahydrodipicolinate synthase [Campylobacteraceae bacterium]MBT4179107.1 4-hydroxy-tetrahydrodipicolinate synthase [Campylobacteraceae bacterium]MBT4572336.1 4-hydroxy-tetrahydrodipicolinate synthase [Campylobacteraceae bacterium]MBT4707284.1 4-hydroxy-tetrahydrodipicolinate synthase [Campylobacteraceae bacterium]